MERRFLPAGAGAVKVEQRAEGEPPVITGYGAVFYDAADPGTEYLFDQWRGTDYLERIMPGAFDRALREDDVAGLLNHNPDNLLGRTSAGTMKLSVDRKGLRYEITPPDTEAGRSVLASVRRGDLNGSSFAFLPQEQAFREIAADGKEIVVREIHAVRLYDTGPVVFPAYSATTTGTRAAGDVTEARKAYEEWRAKKGPPLSAKLAAYRARAAEAEAGGGI